MKIRELLNKLTNRKIMLTIIVVLILCYLMLGIKNSHAFYNNSATIPLVNAKVGDFLNPTTGNIDRKTDVNLIYYMENEDKIGEYILSSMIPVYGFTIDSANSVCNLSSANYSIASDGSVTVNATMSLPSQVVCRLFYKKSKTTDITIYALVENEYGTIANDNKKYTYSTEIPDSSKYVYSNVYKCGLGSTTISYNAESGVTYTGSAPDTCYLYFNKR